MTALARLDRDRSAGVNRAWNSRHRCRDRRPAVAMAYLQSITMLVIWAGSAKHHARPPLPAALDCRGYLCGVRRAGQCGNETCLLP